jgi:predicted anti-sigma-YlaC factor YlaD
MLSARLDGESIQGDELGLDDHLDECAACRAWLAGATELTRTVRSQAADVPDLTDRVLAAVAGDPAPAPTIGGPAAERGRQVLRWSVGFAAFAQLMFALPVLLGGLGDPHASRELASLEVALAVGYALAAFRPERARAFVPVAVVLGVCLALTSAIDIANASTVLVHEVGHLVAVVQAGLLWALGRTAAPTRPGISGIAVPGPAA